MKQLLFKNGDEFPILGLGTYLSKKNEVYNAVVEAIRIGYRHIDCAYIYGNEREIGEALRFVMDAGMVTREDLFITSKLWNSDHAPERVEVAIRKTLASLQLDYLDLYLIHWPIAFKTGQEQAKVAADLVSLTEMPVEKTWQGMEAVCQAGLTRHIGVSNFNIPKLQKLIDVAAIKPEVNQIELHPYFQQPDLLQFCEQNGVLVTAYSPLGSRHLINTEAGITNENAILSIADKHACTPAQVLLAWGMARGTVVIPKTVNFQRLVENFGSVGVTLDADDLRAIEKLERNLRLAKGAYCVLPGGAYTLQNIWEE